jgi:glycosyltransferase involved in cell wall biosynthesis
VASKLNILVLNTQVPFTRGGAEVLVDGLIGQLRNRGHNCDLVQLPFSAIPKRQIADQMVLWRALKLEQFAGHKVDLIIGTKFPSYLPHHPNKTVWLIHQHRQAYELYGTRFGDFEPTAEDEAVRQLILETDREALGEAKHRFTISPNVKKRLERYCGLDAEALLPPLPLDGRYLSREPEPYLLYVGRICSIKRVDLLIRSLPAINGRLKVKLVGVADEPMIEAYIQSEIRKHHLGPRVEFLGRVDDETLIDLYSRAYAVFYAPFDEDYGFVTLEALASGRPVITAEDSGGVRQFITDGENGLVVEPEPEKIASAINRLWDDPSMHQRLLAGCNVPKLNTWDEIVNRLTEAGE